MKKILIFFGLIVLTFLFSTEVKASSDYPYYIKNYYVDMEVNKDYTVDVSETIDVVFSKPATGIIKYISTTGYYVDKTEKRDRYSIDLKSLSIDNSYSLLNEDNQYIINITSDDKFTGEKTFNIKYTLSYSCGDNDLYLSIINNRWSTYIKNASFKITFPDNIDTSKIFLTRGSMYSTDTSEITYSYKNNVLTGKITKSLNAYEGICLNTPISSHYFNASNTDKRLDFVIMVFMILNALAVYYIWNKNGKDYKKIDTIAYHPNKKFNPLEFEYIENECDGVPSRAVTALVIYLAKKGYIKIERNFNKVMFIKLKEYKEDNEIERVLMKELFRKDSCIVIDNMDLRYKKIILKIKRLINTRENKKLVLETSKWYVKLVPILLGIINVFLTLIVISDTTSIIDFIYEIILTCFSFYLIAYGMLTKSSIKKQVMLIVGLTIFIINGALTVFESLNLNMFYLVFYIVGISTYTIIMALLYLMPKRSVEGNKLYSEVVNFRYFIETLSEDMLKVLCNENKNYFYEIFPYVYAMGLDNVFIGKYEKVKKIVHPKWYEDKTDK